MAVLEETSTKERGVSGPRRDQPGNRGRTQKGRGAPGMTRERAESISLCYRQLKYAGKEIMVGSS